MTRKPDRAAARVGCGLLDQKIGLAFEKHQAGRIEVADTLYREVLEADPRNGAALHGLGLVTYHRGDLAQAEELIRQSIELDGTQGLHHYHLGVVLQGQGAREAALASFRRALELDPHSADAHVGVGGVRYELGERDLAEDSFRRAIGLDPNHVKAHSNLGVALTARCLLEEAIHHFETATDLSPDHALAHWNNAIALLLSGDFETGWREYEWRLQRPGSTPTEFSKPRWTGDALAGRTILIHAEQGLGDAIQFCRYASTLVESGRVLLAVQPSLKRLMASLQGVAGILVDQDPLPAFDVHCPLLSLPGLFETRLETIPADVPYLAAQPAAVQAFSDRLGPGDHLNVGLVWAGNPRLQNDLNRSIPLERFRSLVEVPGARFVSLQKDKRAGDQELLASLGGIADLAPHLEDFADTAAAIEALDLVISVDTSVAHLAGALGKPVWLLLPFAPDWRWMLHREDSPWYPSMRLFRQTQARSWPEVLAAVAEALPGFRSTSKACPGNDGSGLSPRR